MHPKIKYETIGTINPLTKLKRNPYPACKMARASFYDLLNLYLCLFLIQQEGPRDKRSPSCWIQACVWTLNTWAHLGQVTSIVPFFVGTRIFLEHFSHWMTHSSMSRKTHPDPALQKHDIKTLNPAIACGVRGSYGYGADGRNRTDYLLIFLII